LTMNGRELDWFVHADGQTIGPISHLELLDRVRNGTLKRADLVWKPGEPERKIWSG
jgi:GYF domain 2